MRNPCDGDGAYWDVTVLPDLTDEQIDDLFTESPIFSGELTAFILQVRETFVEAPAESVERRHIEAIIRCSGMADGEGRSGAQQGSSRWAEARPAPWRPLGTRLAFQFAIALVVAILVSGGLAVTGSLPDPMQRVVAKVAGTFGITLETRDERGESKDASNKSIVSDSRDFDSTHEANRPVESDGSESRAGRTAHSSDDHQRTPGSGLSAQDDDAKKSAAGKDGSPSDELGSPPDELTPAPGEPEAPAPGELAAPQPGTAEAPTPGESEEPPPEESEEASPGEPEAPPSGEADPQLPPSDESEDPPPDKPNKKGGAKPDDAGDDKPKDKSKGDKPKENSTDPEGDGAGSPP